MARDITQLHPELQDKLKRVISDCEAAGIMIKIGECYRSIAEQEELYAQGRTKAGNIVTNARGTSYSSQHQWGIAADFYLAMDVDGDGKTSDDAFNDSTNLFSKVGAIAKKNGLGWGGDWKSPVDKPHLFLPQWGNTTSQLKAKYGTPTAFRAIWSKSTPTSKKAPDMTIKGIQRWINQYSMEEISEDGYFGPETKKALLKCLQIYLNIAKGAKLAIDGVWGPKTEAACIVASGKSDLVRILQSILYCSGYNPGPIDGIEGSQTRATVKEFQKYNGLTVDGKAGRNTFKKLFK